MAKEALFFFEMMNREGNPESKYYLCRVGIDRGR